MVPSSALPRMDSRSQPVSPYRQRENSQSSSHKENWECPQCTTVNSVDYRNCTMCFGKKPGHRISLHEEQEKAPKRGIVNPRFAARFKALFSDRPPEWECPQCTFVNGGYYTQCQSCQFERIVQKPLGSNVDRGEGLAKRRKSVPEETASEKSVFDSLTEIFRRRKPPTKDGVAEKETRKMEERERGQNGREREKKKKGKEWTCQSCTMLNSNSLDKCQVCDAPRDTENRSSAGSRDSPMPVEADTAFSSNASSLRQNGEEEEVVLGRPHITDPRMTPSYPGPGEDESGTVSLPALPLSPQRQQQQQLEDRDRLSLLSSQGAPTWRCKVCGAYNVVMKGLRQCYICGIGVIPDCYLQLSPTAGPGANGSRTNPLPSTVVRPPSHPQQNSSHSSDRQPGVRGGSSPSKITHQDSANQPYVNAYVNQSTPQNHEYVHIASRHQSPTPRHPPVLTHHNQFQVSPSPSPQHNTGSNDRAHPQLEQQSPHHQQRLSEYANSQSTASEKRHLRLNRLANSRGLPARKSYLDPYARPRTPTGLKTLQQLQPSQHPAENGGAQHHRQHSDEGAKTHWLEESVQFNRTKCLNAIRQEDVLHANSVYRGIQQYCRESGEAFTDPDFPPADRSLYSDPREPVPRWRVGKWERPASVRDVFDSGRIEWTVVRNPRPEDIAQGALGNCWVLSALGVVAEQPQLIEDIIITKKYSPRVGAYQVRLCRDGQWEVVVIDDCLPCLKTGELVFSKAHRKQLWVPLIEKALAKLYGSYEALNAGRVLLGLSVLTGLPCEKIHLKKPSNKEEDIDTDLVWAKLLSFREREFPMSASCGGEGEEDERGYAEKGLEANHAYSILDVRQLGTERLVRLRNPWGKYSWQGSWSDCDPRWVSQPWLRDELQAVGGEAGVFWMGAQDFFKYFCEVDICKYRPNWHSVRSEGKLLPYAAGQIKTLAFEVHTNTEVDISIYQPSNRGRSRRHNLVDLAVLVLRYPSTYDRYPSSQPSPLPVSCSLESGCHIQSIVTTEGLLAPGRYVILPLAFNHYRHLTEKGSRNGLQERGTRNGEHRNEGGKKDVTRQRSTEGAIPYVVSVFSAQELAYENVTTRPGFLPESLILLAQKIGKVSQPFPNMMLYEVYMKHSCRFLVAVNFDHQLHFTVTCDGLDSVNVLCSRGDMYTQDCIPPRHRQVLWVLTQLESSVRYSVLMRISFSCTPSNPQGQWGAQHTPPLNSTTAELHAPRLIS